MDFCRKTILLLIFSSFMSVGWGQSHTENYTQEIINISDNEVLIISNYEMGGYTYSDTTYISVSRLLPPCDDGYTEIYGECYYQSDLDVLQQFIDNSFETINMDMDIDSSGVIEPLELGTNYWNEGRIITLECNGVGLSGGIPTEIGELTDLTILHLYSNQLTGEIPIEIGNLINLTRLWLTNNQLIGEIPESIGNLTNLTILWISNNQLIGEIPTSIGNLSEVIFFYLSGNQLVGEIPESIYYLTNLEKLYLYNNQLSGEISVNIDNLINLDHLYLSGNQLSGVISEGICNLSDNCIINFNNNNICPPYPECLTEEDIGYQVTSECEDPSLCDEEIEVELWGECYNIEETTGIYLFNSQLTGEIPSEIGNLTNLLYLQLGHNNLIGEIPSEIGNLTNLENLFLGENELVGEIPVEIGNLTNLTILELNNNQLTGDIPESICFLFENNYYVSLFGNNFCPPYLECIGDNIGYQDTSECPLCDEGYTEIDGECYFQSDLDVLQDIIDHSQGGDNPPPSDLSPIELCGQVWFDGRLVNLYCSGDDLEQDESYIDFELDIPESMGNLTSLMSFGLEYNNLSSIPESIGNLTNLVGLLLHHNQLSSLPESIGNLTNLTGLDVDNNQLTSLPESIGNLTNLTRLLLPENQLTNLPESIGNLTNLTDLYLFSNNLTSIPESIGNLSSLELLWLQNNQLSEEIPETICDLNINFSYSNYFNISNNNLCPPYPECIEDYVGYQDTSECVECNDVIGDTNDDDQVDIRDIVLIMNFIFSDEYDYCSDLNGDENLNILDIKILIDFILIFY